MKTKPRGLRVRPGAHPPTVAAAQVRITEHVPAARTVTASDVVIVCPWLAGLPADSGLWISALPIHDVNSFVEDAPALTAPAKVRALLYFGVFALDRLRTTDQLLAGLRNKGVERLINLPSVSFFDGATAQTFDMLDFSFDQEIEFLRHAKHAGFGVALCARRGLVLSPPDIFDFVLLHSGPGGPMELTAPMSRPA
jgi:predicted TIM-barrel enzyme